MIDELPGWDKVLSTMGRRGRPRLPPKLGQLVPANREKEFLDKYQLRTSQYVRILLCLLNSRGPLSRLQLAEKNGNKTTAWVGRAIGYTDPVKREKFEKTKDGGGKCPKGCNGGGDGNTSVCRKCNTPFKPGLSLLTLGLVSELEYDNDGINPELLVALTPAGREIAREWVDQKLVLPPLLDRPRNMKKS